MSHQLPPGRTGSDVDQVYVWGRPASTYLAPHQIVRLMLLRSRLDDPTCCATAPRPPTRARSLCRRFPWGWRPACRPPSS